MPRLCILPQYFPPEMGAPQARPNGVVHSQYLVRILVAVFVTNFLLGLVFSYWLFPSLLAPTRAESWGDGHWEIARNVLRGNGFVFDPKATSTSMTGSLKREPVYVLFLVAGMKLFGENVNWLGLSQSLVNSFTCVLVFFIAARVFSRKVGLLACIIYSVAPFAYWYLSRIAYETVSAFLVSLLTMAMVVMFEKPSYWKALSLGLLLGLTTLCRATFLWFPLLLLPVFVYRFRSKIAQALRHAIVVIVACLVVLTPWMIRNYIASNQIVPITTMGGISYFIGNATMENYSLWSNTPGHAADLKGARIWQETLKVVGVSNPGLPNAQLEALTDQQLRKEAVQDVLANPVRFAWKLLGGGFFIWYLSTTTLKSNLLLVVQLPLVALSLLGWYAAVKSKRDVMPLSLVILFQVFVYAAISPFGRYSYPFLPLIVCLAANESNVLLAWVSDKYQSQASSF